MSVRGEDYLGGDRRQDLIGGDERIKVGNGPGMTIFSPDGKYGYVCSSFVARDGGRDTVADSQGRRTGSRQDSPFCPNIAATPEGDQVWLTLKDVGKTDGVQRRSRRSRC